jgi:hypothetical protein
VGWVPSRLFPTLFPAQAKLTKIRKFAHLSSGLFYNGCTEDDIPGANLTNNHKCGIQVWAEHGIAGRGVLLDYAGHFGSSAQDPFQASNITLSDLRVVAKHQGLDLRTVADGGDIRVGDILLIRSGWTKAYGNLTAAERKALADRPYFAGPNGEFRFIGVDQSDEMATWIHDSYFSLVAGDMPAFESWPPQGPLALHEKILSLWGVGLGEYTPRLWGYPRG